MRLEDVMNEIYVENTTCFLYLGSCPEISATSFSMYENKKTCNSDFSIHSKHFAKGNIYRESQNRLIYLMKYYDENK